MPDGSRVHALLERASSLALETEELDPLLELQLNVAEARARALIGESQPPAAVLPQTVSECIAVAWSEVLSWGDEGARLGSVCERLALDVAELNYLIVAKA